MPLPKGYLPRNGDEVLIRARAKRDTSEDADGEGYFEIVGREHNKFFMQPSEIHSLYLRNWDIGTMVTCGGEFEGPAEVIAVDGAEVWCRTENGIRWTIEANELEPHIAPEDDLAVETMTETEA